MIQVCLPLNSSSPALGQNSLMHAELKNRIRISSCEKAKLQHLDCRCRYGSEMHPFYYRCTKTKIACSAPTLQYLYFAF